MMIFFHIGKDFRDEVPLESKVENDFYYAVINYFKKFENHSHDIKIFGKNFYLSNCNNAIKYGYVNDGIRTTYPDFIIQYKDIFYIIEIKSNEKKGLFDQTTEEKYRKKYESINEAYKATSKKIPKYVFAVIIKENGNSGNSWTIYKSTKGKQTRHSSISDLFKSN